jgi:hypothetical protein
MWMQSFYDQQPFFGINIKQLLAKFLNSLLAKASRPNQSLVGGGGAKLTNQVFLKGWSKN